MSFANDLIAKMNGRNVNVSEADYNACGYHLEAHLEKEQVRDFAQAMLDQGFFLDFVTAVHTVQFFQIVYQFAHPEESCRINAKTDICEGGSISTISDIYHGANWHERETHDFYGVNFTDHPDLRVLLLAEGDENLKPLLKNEVKIKPIDEITRKRDGQDQVQKSNKDD